jgi:hypothetical protein
MAPPKPGRQSGITTFLAGFWLVKAGNARWIGVVQPYVSEPGPAPRSPRPSAIQRLMVEGAQAMPIPCLSASTSGRSATHPARMGWYSARDDFLRCLQDLLEALQVRGGPPLGQPGTSGSSGRSGPSKGMSTTSGSETCLGRSAPPDGRPALGSPRRADPHPVMVVRRAPRTQPVSKPAPGEGTMRVSRANPGRDASGADSAE